MNSVFWIKLLNEAIPLLLLIGMSIVIYRGLKKNQSLLADRGGLVRRYLLFRGDKQIRLNIYGGQDEQVKQELLKTLSNSWKNFKRREDQYRSDFIANTARTKIILQAITLGLLVNSTRMLLEEYYFYGFEDRFFLTGAREVLNYVPVFLSFFLLRGQARPHLASNAGAPKLDVETLFFPSPSAREKDYEYLYNEFSPLDDDRDDQTDSQEEDQETGDGKENQNHYRGAESRSRAQ